MSAPAQIFYGPLDASFQTSQPIQIVGGLISLDFEFVITNVAAQIQWYLTYTSGNPFDPATVWYREVSEELQTYGVVRMAEVVRRFYQNGGTDLTIGTHRESVQLMRANNFARVNINTLAGTVQAKIQSAFNNVPTPA